ncbi:MAG TPA: hypothetical protein PKB10_03465 [Tepidisphaeraceae bacterium]|nr:hypothetical protein [Tepidisphaeraceae bacterium]
MRLPNGDRAEIDRRKLVDYCLSPVHPQGKHKSKLFRASLGLTDAEADVQWLIEALHSAAMQDDAIEKEAPRGAESMKSAA